MTLTREQPGALLVGNGTVPFLSPPCPISSPGSLWSWVLPPQVPSRGGERGGVRWAVSSLGLHTHTPMSADLHPLPRQDIASPKFSMPSPVRTVIAADFDNDQELEIFFNNFAHRSSSANRLFR